MVVGILGYKWSIVISIFGFVVWMGANAYAVFATLVPASVVSGTSAAIMWTAESTFIAKAGHRLRESLFFIIH